MLTPMHGESLSRRNIPFRKPNRWKRKPKAKPTRNRHHMTNVCKGGKSDGNNILVMKIDRHAALHRTFKNMSWEEIGDTLHSIFGLRDPQKCYDLIRRVSRVKGRVA